MMDIFDIYPDASQKIQENRIWFGKHKGCPIEKIPTDYVNWLLSIETDPDFGEIAKWVQAHSEELHARLCHIDPALIPEYELEPDQAQAANEIIESLFEVGHSWHRLQGGAGYGKSFCAIDVVIRAKRDYHYHVTACATSYVASQNLGKDLEPLGVPCRTIASTLRLEKIYEGMLETYSPGKDTDVALAKLLGKNKLLIVDEYSMVDDKIGKLLMDAVVQYGGRLLVIGDVYQLPSPAQNWDSRLCGLRPVSTLTLPKRYRRESDLFEVEQIVRNDPYHFDASAFSSDFSLQVFTVGSKADLIRKFVEVFRAYPDQQTLMLWFRRKDMTESNEAIRLALFGEGAPDVADGERLRVQRTSDYTEEYNAKESVRYYSGTSLKVKEAFVSTKVISIPEICYWGKDAQERGMENGAPTVFTIPCTYVTLEHSLGSVATIAVLFSITENSASGDKIGGKEFNKATDILQDWCRENDKWDIYRAFRNCFVQVAYQYASTVHRVQGQSLDNVFVSPAALRQSDPYQSVKLQYVGLTRAKQRLFCL